MKVSGGLFLALVAATGVAARSDRNTERCRACRLLVNDIKQGLANTEGRADEQVAIGNRLDANGKLQPSKVIRYGDSHKRLDDVLENICKSSDCKELVSTHAEAITTWFDEARSTDLFNYLCVNKLSGCTAEVAKSSDDDVVVEDDSSKKKEAEPVKKQPQAAAPKKESAAASGKGGAATGAGQFDPMSIVHTVVNRFKGNMQRIWRLTVELKGEVQPMLVGKKWPQLKSLLLDRLFWQKYWIVFVAWTFAVYFIYGLIEPFLGSAKKKNVRSTRSASGVASGSGKKKASSSKVGKKDE